MSTKKHACPQYTAGIKKNMIFESKSKCTTTLIAGVFIIIWSCCKFVSNLPSKIHIYIFMYSIYFFTGIPFQHQCNRSIECLYGAHLTCTSKQCLCASGYYHKQKRCYSRKFDPIVFFFFNFSWMPNHLLHVMWLIMCVLLIVSIDFCSKLFTDPFNNCEELYMWYINKLGAS